MFEFHRVGWINQAEEEVSGWLALITTKEQLDDFLNTTAYELANVWLDIKKSPDKQGHCRTRKANIMKLLLNLKMEKEEKQQLPMVECISFMERIATCTVINIFCNDGEVYVGRNGACRPTHLRDDGRLDEEIFERCTNKDFVFPCMSENDVTIDRWAGGPHFYIQVNGKNVEIDGEVKYNTIERAEEVRKNFIKQNRFKRD